jgi:hypothetical protein
MLSRTFLLSSTVLTPIVLTLITLTTWFGSGPSSMAG